MRRKIVPERLDDLQPGDPQAVGSRGDLRRLNFIMGHAGILCRAFREPFEEAFSRTKPLRFVELGAGDGTLSLQLARYYSALGMRAHGTLVDRHDLVTPDTRRAFIALNWSVESEATDVFTWLERPSPAVDVIFANLFLHHFTDPTLAAMMRLAATKTNGFIACEPRRSPWALAGSRMLWLIGCNDTTQHDAPVSVRAGFIGQELSALWPTENDWRLSEQSAGLFSHCFIANRRE
jgi:hypothetical protein